MTQIRVNLIPPERRLRASRVRALRRWGVTTASFGGFLFLTLLVSRFVWSIDDGVVRNEIESARNEARSEQVALTELSGRIANATTRMRAEQAVGQQPDWSVLLAVVASTLEEKIVLRLCAIEPEAGETRPSARRERGTARDLPTSPERFRFVLSGYGRTPQDVSMFALRLEQHELFHRVRLSDTKREPFLQGHATSFRIECELGLGSGGEEAAP